jgi:hypothetical protein
MLDLSFIFDISEKYQKKDYKKGESYNNVCITGFDKNMTRDEIILLAIYHNCPIIVKNGRRGKWYLKGQGKSFDDLKREMETRPANERDGVYCILLKLH